MLLLLSKTPEVAPPEELTLPADASPAALELYEALDPAFTLGDEGRGWVSLKICMALVAGRLDLLHSYLIDDATDRSGWAIVFNPLTAPIEALPYLAQFSGAILRPDMDEEARRNAITKPEAFRRGTLAAFIEVAKRRLTGTKAVVVTERYTEKAWRVRVETLESETPEPAATKAELEELAKPIGILLFFNSRVAWTWGEAKVSAEFPTWNTVIAGFPTWLDFRTYEP